MNRSWTFSLYSRSRFPQTSLRSLSLAILVSLLIASPALSAEVGISKVLLRDEAGSDTIAEITNTGTINALDRLFQSPSMPADVKALAMAEVLTGASASGKLVKTTLISGDVYYALDDVSGHPITVEWTGTESRLPTGSYGFTRWDLPIGAQ